jgi:hypothetical protein
LDPFGTQAHRQDAILDLLLLPDYDSNLNRHQQASLYHHASHHDILYLVQQKTPQPVVA